MAKLNDVKTVDMVNGEITKVSYGGVNYVKLDDQKTSARGDIIAFTKKTDIQDVTIGGFYEVKSVTPDSPTTKYAVIFKDDCGDTSERHVNKCRLEIFRAEQAPLSVGDYVVVVNNDGLENNVGDVVVLTVVDDSPTYPYECAKEAYMPSQIRKATVEEVASAKAQAEADAIERKRTGIFTANGRKVNEYREGDIVRLISRHSSCNEVGDIGEVIEEYRAMNVRVQVSGKDDYGNFSTVKSLEPLVFVENRLDRN